MSTPKNRAEEMLTNLQKRAREVLTVPEQMLKDAKKTIAEKKLTPVEVRKSLDGWLDRMQQKPIVEHLRKGDAKAVWQDTREGLGRTFDSSVHKVMNVLHIADAKDIAHMKNEVDQLNKRVEEMDRKVKTQRHDVRPS